MPIPRSKSGLSILELFEAVPALVADGVNTDHDCGGVRETLHRVQSAIHKTRIRKSIRRQCCYELGIVYFGCK